MIIVTCDQGSPEWHAARTGCITASMFNVARSRLKRNSGARKAGDWSSEALDYAFRVAFERRSGKPMDEGFETWQMRRGHELEPEARMEHEVATGHLVQRAGFVMTDDGKFGASADGLINNDGGSEYKCLVSPERLRTVLFDGDLSEFTDQVQGCMWITGRSWWHLCFYCPALADIGRQITIHEVKRDDDYIEAMEADLVEFDRLVMQYEDRLQKAA